LTLAIFEKIEVYLQKEDWAEFDDIKKEIRKNLKSLLRIANIETKLLKPLVIDIVDILETQ